MAEPLTVRIVDSTARVSRDAGLSVDVPAAQVSDFGSDLEVSGHDGPRLSASDLGLLAQAVLTRPVEGTWQKSESHLSGELPLRPHRRLPSRSLADLLEERVSQRKLGPCHVDEVAAMLVASCRVKARGTSSDGYPVSRRPAPSAGARHPIDIVLLASSVEGLEPGFWRYHPSELALSRLLTEQSVDAVLTAVRDIGRIEGDVAGVLFLVADFSKTLSRYPAGGHLVWLDAGALALLLHLNALDVGLGSTLIATSGLIARADLVSSRQDVIGVAFGSNAW